MQQLIAAQIKKLGAAALCHASRRVDHSHLALLLGHMRCGSTALSNVLCSHDEISGYGEADVNYARKDGVGELVLKQVWRRAWKPTANWQFDKVLHDSCDLYPVPEFFKARAIFVVREPAATIRSIVIMSAKTDNEKFATPALATDYYITRLGALRRLWSRFDEGHRVAIAHSALTAHPQECLDQISKLLQLRKPLQNKYKSQASSWRSGAGDPLSSPKFSRIEPSGVASTLKQGPSIELDDAALMQAQAAFVETCELLGLAV